MCVCVGVCVREREREREKYRGSRHTQSEDEGKSLDNVFAQEQ